MDSQKAEMIWVCKEERTLTPCPRFMRYRSEGLFCLLGALLLGLLWLLFLGILAEDLLLDLH